MSKLIKGVQGLNLSNGRMSWSLDSILRAVEKRSKASPTGLTQNQPSKKASIPFVKVGVSKKLVFTPTNPTSLWKYAEELCLVSYVLTKGFTSS